MINPKVEYERRVYSVYLAQGILSSHIKEDAFQNRRKQIIDAVEKYRLNAKPKTDVKSDNQPSEEPKTDVKSKQVSCFLKTDKGEKILKTIESIGYLDRSHIPWRATLLSWSCVAKWVTNKYEVNNMVTKEGEAGTLWKEWAMLIGTTDKKLKRAYYEARRKGNIPTSHVNIETELNKLTT